MDKKESIPLCRPSISEDDIALVTDVLRSGWLAHGDYNHRFEIAFAELLGVSHAISMNSCTSALEVALKVAKIQGEVIVPSMTWVATANAVVTSGACPVFCDVDERTRNVTVETLEQCRTPRTEAVMPVHFGGQPCDMDSIEAFCAKHDLLLIEDSAETLGATWNGKQAGSFGVGCFSFFPTKNITTGEGGMLTCQDAKFAEDARALIAHGIRSTTFAREKVARPWLRAAELAGHNYRMPNPLAALGWSQLQRLEAMNAERVRLALRYNEMLAALNPVLKLPDVVPGATHVYQMYTVQVERALRDRLVNVLRQKGIGASVHFDPPVHLQPAYREWHHTSLPVTEKLACELITLPLFPGMNERDQDRVVGAIKGFWQDEA